MSSSPTLVMVPGGWHGPETWDKLASTLKGHNINSVAVTLPTTDSDPSANFSSDVKAVRDAIVAETTQGRNVVIVVHSYGGAVGVSAIKGLTPPPQGSAAGNEASGHVIGIFMISTGFAVEGMTFMEGIGGKPPPTWKDDTETGLAKIVVDPREMFYHDLPEEEGNDRVSKLRDQSMKAFTEGYEAAYAGWKEVPVWYLATAQDKAFPFEAQKAMAQGANSMGGDVTLREIESSHSPMLSKPAETADIILEAIEAFSR